MLYLWAQKDRLDGIEKFVKKRYPEIRVALRPFDGKMPQLKPGDTCIGFGKEATVCLASAGLVPKNRSIASLRSQAIQIYAGKAAFFVTYDTNFVMKEYERKADIEWDVALAHRFATRGTVEPEVGVYRYVDDSFDGLIAKLDEMSSRTQRPVPISVDLETVSLDPYCSTKHIVSIAASYAQGHAEMIRFDGPDDPMYPPNNPKLLANLTRLATDRKLVMVRGANFKFDQGWMGAKWGLPDWPTFSFDTTLVGSLLDENRSNSLNLHAKLFTSIGGYDDGFNRQFDKSRMDLVPKEPLLAYGGGDVDATLRVSKRFAQDLMRDQKLMRFYQKLLHPAAKAFAVMEQRGMVVDRERYRELESQLLVELKETEERALQLIPGRIRMKYADDLKISRPALVTDFMFGPIGLKLKPKMTTAKTGEPSTAIEHLEMFDHPEAVEFVSAYRQWQSAKKTMSTYVTGFLVHLREDGRFHPSYMLHRGAYGEKDTESGTVTGRTSAKDPAYQTVPKHTKWAKPLRSVYVAPPGYAVLNADYSQGELRITACVANEPMMIALYRRGEDLHLATGAEANAMTLEQAKKLSAEERGMVRQGGKAGNFGLIYGMMEDGFVEYARSTYHVDLTHAQATAFRNRFFAKYKRLPVWHTETRAIARKHKMVRSPLGRIRRLPMIDSWAQDVRSKQERQAINSQIQSTLSDMGLLAIALLYERYPELWVFGFTHDAISCYVPEDAVTEWALRIREVMETLPLQSFGWRPQLPFPVDVEVGARMDSMKTLDLPR